MMLVCIKTSIKASRAEKKPPRSTSRRIAAGCQGGRTTAMFDAATGITRARTAWPPPFVSSAVSSARCSSWTGCKASSCAAGCSRAEQGGSAQRAGPRHVLQPTGRNPRPQFRAAALPCQRPQSGDGGHRVVEHGLSGAGSAWAAWLNGHVVDDALLQYLSPLGWEHINLTGDYLWRSSARVGAGKFRPLRPLPPA